MSKDVDPATADVAKLDAERKLKEQREKELSAPRMRELKEANLKFFDHWRTRVIERVGETVTSKQEAKNQTKSVDSPDSKAHAPGDSKVDAGNNEHEQETDDTLRHLFPPIETPLIHLPEKSRILVVHSLLLLLLSLEHYVAPSRVLLLYLTSSLKLPLKVLTDDEEKVAKGLLEAAKQMSGDSETRKKVDENKDSRKWKVGLASVAGAALIGVTGGLAAPLVAAGVGSVMGGLGLGATAAAGYLGSVAGSSIIVGGLFGAYGGRMTGQVMDKYAREVEDFAFLPVRKQGGEKEQEAEKLRDSVKEQSERIKGTSPKSNLESRPESQDVSTSTPKSEVAAKSPQDVEASAQDPAERRLRVTIGISGWLTSKAEVDAPWRVIGHNSEVFALRWELEALMNLGNSLDAMVSSAAWGYAKSEIIQRTIFAELMSAAMWPVAILQVGRVVDNPFSIAKSRADKAGEVLADALINKAQGERPVTLIGYSLGGRVIFSCLKSLARRRAFGLVESAVLIGAPTPATTADWRVLRSVVGGRLLNVFSSNDYILGFLYRTSSIQYGVAGLQKIEGIPSVENVDVSETVNGHLRYRYLVGSILKKIGFEDIDLQAVEEEEAAFKKMTEEEQKKTYTETAKESSQKVLDDNPLGIKNKSTGGDDAKGEAAPSEKDERQRLEKEAAEAEAQKMEQQVKQKTEQGMLQSAWDYLPSALQSKGNIAEKGPDDQREDQGSSVEPENQQNTGSAKDSGGSWTTSLTGGYLK